MTYDTYKRRQYRRALFIWCVSLAGLVLLILSFAALSCRGELPAGSILLSFGLSNTGHAAIADGRGNVVEAQSPYGVVLTPQASYDARGYRSWVRYPVNPQVGQRAADYAVLMVGRPYGRYASVGPGIVRNILGMPQANCVSVVQQSLAYAYARPWLGYVTPTDIWYDPRLPRVVPYVPEGSQ